MKCIRRIAITATVAGLTFAVAPAFADDFDTGFLSDYTHLQPLPNFPADRAYIAPDAFERLGNYNAVMVDQPVIVVAASSKYKGLKPDDMKALSDSFRTVITEALSESYRIAEAPGPDVLYVRVAIGNLHLKKPRRLIDFTPVGVVKNTAKAVFIDDITKKISLIELTLETEILDSQTGDRIAAVVEQRGQAKDKDAGIKEDATSWDELEAGMKRYSKRLVCRMDNARLPEAEWANCFAIL